MQRIFIRSGLPLGVRDARVLKILEQGMALDQLLPILERVQAQGSVPWAELKELFGW